MGLPAAQVAHDAGLIARRLLVSGHVQAVGFRPFVYRLAHDLKLRGWVRNRTGQVEIFVQGARAAVARFEHQLIAVAPPLARPELQLSESVPPGELDDFEIAPSESGDQPRIFVPPDYFACPDCLAELLIRGIDVTAIRSSTAPSVAHVTR